MRILRAFQLSLCAALLCATLGSCIKGQTWNKRTIVTFNDSVEIPGQVLPAGTYIFKLADSISNRNIVQIWNGDESQIFATLLAVPSYRREPAGRSIFEFDERPGDSPQALRAWIYPGDDSGPEFIYPHFRHEPQSNAANRDQ